MLNEKNKMLKENFKIKHTYGLRKYETEKMGDSKIKCLTKNKMLKEK